MKHRRQRLSKTPVQASIDNFSHDGRGIARLSGKTTFIDGALPDEIVMFQYTRKKNDYDEGFLLNIIEPSPLRAEPPCSHYQLCGGCSLQHIKSEAQIDVKQTLLLDILSRVGHCQPEIVLKPLRGPLTHYRNKARLSVRYVEKKQSTLVGFREKNNPRYITEINECVVLNSKINEQILALRALIDTFDDPHSIAQIEVAAGDEDIALIFRNLTPLSDADGEKIRLFADKTQFRIFLQPEGTDSVYLFYPQQASDFLNYQLPDYGLQFKFHPTDFTQVNAAINRQMIVQALELLALETNDVILDLFCGLGNFSLPLAKHCSHVVGVEGSEMMVSRAQMNAALNDLNNVEFLAANLENENVLATLKHHQFNKILLDPPRTGALAVVKQMHIINPKRIVYVSCNPVTLARDAEILINQQGYRLVSAGAMDMFPHTSHVESIALFVKG